MAISDYALASSLPANVEAERSILGAILLDNFAYNQAAEHLRPEDFSLDSHRRIYFRMENLAESSRPIDMITLVEELDRRKELEAIGDVGYISGLVDGVPDRPSIKHYVKIVREKAAQRKVIHACNVSIGSIGEGSSSNECIGDLSERLLQIQTGSDDAPAERILTFSDAVFNDWERLADSENDLVGLTTGVG